MGFYFTVKAWKNNNNNNNNNFLFFNFNNIEIMKYLRVCFQKQFLKKKKKNSAVYIFI